MLDAADKLGHQIIMASAGTGKTFALTGRLISLLSLGVPLERIVALTFTRAAAGEMFDKLVTRLAAAAGDPATASEEATRHLRMPQLDQDRFRALLRQVTSRMHLSPIGTLDAFFVRVVQLFPFEFGLSGEFALVEGHALALEQQRVLRAILRTPATAGDADARERFFEAFKRATFGAEEKRLHGVLEGFVADYHALYLGAANPAAWGDPECIWAGSAPWWRELAPRDARQAADDFNRLLAALDPTDVQHERWLTFTEEAARFRPGHVVSKSAGDVLGKLLAAREDLARGQAQILVMRRRFELTPALCAAALRLAGHIVACVMQSRLESTQGVRDILARYETMYDATVRGNGRLSFADVTHLMTRGAFAETRLGLEYRLDGRYDHWAIDEFQDTSRAQWAGVQPLVDEVIQDAEGRRTFFAVGDVKQAIYGWRGGDARLLADIADYYRIPRLPLNASFRCGPAVIEAVNRVFSNLAQTRLPAATVARWAAVWEPHRSARPDLAGSADLREVIPAAGGSRASQADWGLAVGDRLERGVPWRRGLSVGVLVRSNPQGAALTEALRSRGIPAVWTGDKAIADNPVVTAVLDLFRFAEHPGDRFAWEHLLMTPLRHCLGEAPETAAARVSAEVLAAVAEKGFASALEPWLVRLDGAVELDPFSRQRLQALLDAAEAFDRTGNRSCLDFADFVNDYTVSDIAAAGTVHVMTIHRSKGLGFDVVVLPLFPGRTGLDGIQSPDVVHGRGGDASGARDWLMLAPPADIARADPVLRRALEESSIQSAFEELCVLYVGMTRARRALHVLVPPPPKDEAASVHLHTLVRELLGGPPRGEEPALLASIGDGIPYAALPFREPPCAPTPAPHVTVSPGASYARGRHRRATPSHHDDVSRDASELFVVGRRRGMAFGSALHALFETVEWLDGESAAEVVDRWRARTLLPADLAGAVAASAARALAADDVRRELSRPPGRVELWRERSFEMALASEWVSGTFDRVVVSLGEDGRPLRAHITDFKSDRVETDLQVQEAAARYGVQMRVYRQALSRLTGLSLARIEARLVFTHAGRVVTVTD